MNRLSRRLAPSLEQARHRRPRFAVLSHVLPPSPTGQAIVLHRLLRDLPADWYCLMSVDPGAEEQGGTETEPATAGERLPGRYWHLVGSFPRDYETAYWQQLMHGSRLTRSLLARARHIANILRRQRCRALVACSGELLDIPAGFMAARSLGIAFFAYMFDDYASQWVRPFPRGFAQAAWRALARLCTGVIVPNEALQAAYRDRYGIESVIVRNPTDDLLEPGDEALPWPARADEIRLVYTGSIYDAHLDAFRNLIEALRRLEQPRIRLHVYSSFVASDLRAEERTAPVVFHAPLPLEESLRVQRQADVLFLPLAFHSPYPEIVRTSAPGKMGELLASGRPVLVHAPADSFVSQYCRAHDCALVIDCDDPKALAAGIRRLLGDADLRSRLTAHAQESSQRDFSRRVAQESFLKAVLRPMANVNRAHCV
jgi:glycosyltransferase involved in cell wall biosynthesis